MKIKKRVDGHDIIFQYDKVKDYKDYTLYDVYKVLNDKKIYMYKTCLSEIQVTELANCIQFD